MQNIPLPLARPGMVLAREVLRPTRPNGPVLFGRGVTLNEAAIERLQQIGVEFITVKGRPVAMESDETLEEQLDKLNRRFHSVEHDPGMMKLKQLFRKQIMRSMGT